MRDIRLRAWERNRGRAAELGEIVRGLRRTGRLSQEQHETARSLTHQLIGSAGTFGHDAVTSALSRVQELLGSWPDRERGSELVVLVAEVSKLLSSEPPPDED